MNQKKLEATLKETRRDTVTFLGVVQMRFFPQILWEGDHDSSVFY
jgi:hypothetical protein